MPLPIKILEALAGDGSGGVSALGGGVATILLNNGMNINALRTLDVLRKDEWKAFDTKLVQIAKARLVGIGDLISAGLVFNLNNPMGTTRLEWEDVSDMTPAELSMSGVTQGENDRVTYSLKALPIPIVHKDFNINIRALMASRQLGQALDTTQMAVAARRVAELNESILFNGALLVSGGASIQGYTTASNRNTGSLTGDWSVVGTTGVEIIADVLAMIASLKADNMFGPYWLYIPTTFDNKLDDDYKAESDVTIRERIMKINSIAAIRVSTDLADGASGEAILVQFTEDVVDLVLGQQPTTVQWETSGGMIFNFKILSIMVPRMKNDQTLQSGIAHYSV